MSKKLAVTLFLSLFVIGMAFSAFILLKGFPITAFTIFLLWGTSLIIFFNEKAFPYRFMYPGLLTFVIFTVLPMFFTIAIGFTNLSTGHVLSEKSVADILRSDIIIEESAFPYPFTLTKKDEKFVITIQDSTGNFYSGIISPYEKKKILNLEKTTAPGADSLSRGDIFELRDELLNWKFLLPTNQTLTYFRTDKLIESKPRYIALEENKFQDTVTNEIFYPNHKTGYFTNGERNLAPGFYTKVGMKNFFSLFTDDRIKAPFIKVFTWTITWALVSVILAFSVGLFLALIVNDEKLRGRAIYRLLLIIPYSIPFFISVIVFRGLLNKDFGAVNEIIASTGIAKVPWLEDPFWAKISCLMVNLWLGFPYMFLVITGILQSIPTSIYEAAELDGATSWQKLRKITLPLIMVAIAPLLVGSFAFNLNNFIGIYLLTGGMPPIQGAVTPVGETDILISYTYRLAFEGGRGQDFGLASSISILIFFIIAILTLVNFKLSGMMKEEKK